ncbi:MAG: hypothetical protein H6733_07810 [Alphaproteobacteria bacterium]|nr:hypothetical protein [Alphaproteobacteria bacterium]
MSEPRSTPPSAPTPLPAVGNLSDVLQDALRRLVAESRDRIVRAADDGRVLLKVRGLQRDRDALWIRLGKIAYRLTESGELDHPALHKAMQHIDDLEDEIARLRVELSASGDDEADHGDHEG